MISFKHIYSFMRPTACINGLLKAENSFRIYDLITSHIFVNILPRVQPAASRMSFAANTNFKQPTSSRQRFVLCRLASWLDRTYQ